MPSPMVSALPPMYSAAPPLSSTASRLGPRSPRRMARVMAAFSSGAPPRKSSLVQRFRPSSSGVTAAEAASSGSSDRLDRFQASRHWFRATRNSHRRSWSGEAKTGARYSRLQNTSCKISSASAGFFIWIRQNRYRDGP